jgi:hypothetical protein
MVFAIIYMREKHENYISTCFKKSKITILAELYIHFKFYVDKKVKRKFQFPIVAKLPL